MGMFDYITFETECPNCKNKVKSFQSKDSVCLMRSLNFWEVNNFYASCPECNTWIEYFLRFKRRPNRKLIIKDYKRMVKIPTKKEQSQHKKDLEEFALLLKGDSP